MASFSPFGFVGGFGTGQKPPWRERTVNCCKLNKFRQEPDLLRFFRRGTSRGTNNCYCHPEVIVGSSNVTGESGASNANSGWTVFL